MRVLVTGAAGMLGGALLRHRPDGVDAVGTDRDEFDLAQPGAAAELLARGFAGVIHAAGFTQVDAAEHDEASAYRDNAETTRELAAECARCDLPLVVVSTDFVFDGDRDDPYTEDDPPNPLGAYARTKLAGERAAFAVHPRGARIVRTAWLYGPGGRHFPGRILELARDHDELRVVDDQRGSPTSTAELAPALWDVLRMAPPGCYHATCEGVCSWYELACATLDLKGVADTRVVPCQTHEVPRPAARPKNSSLDCSRLAALRGRPLAPWRDALARYLEEENA
ncbi:MAG: dTDP-4-dehydrorhamnose reductase [Planctomycetota bacterium]|nr:dTDP-4-dehydrorhamnose reductase [Planctomycetota bacterium]